MARQVVSSLSFPASSGAETQIAAPQVALALGVAGTVPAATADDKSDFIVVVPFDLTLKRMKAAMKTTPSSTTTIQLRKSVDSGSNWTSISGWTVTVNSAAYVGTSDPTDIDLDEGDLLGFSITAGGGSGTNLMVEVIGVPR